MSVQHTGTVVIGGGLMGCWTALMLRRKGHPVVVLEKGAVGAQASGVNYGNLRLQGRYPRQLPLAIRAHEIWERLADFIGEWCEFEATGHLYVAHNNPQDIAKAEASARDAAAHGIATELLDAAQIRARWPWLRGFEAASWSPRDAVANPRLVTPAVARAARALGAEVREGTRVRAARFLGDRFQVETDAGLRIDADHLVNAAGAWAAEVAGWFGETAPLFAAGPPQFVTDAVPYFIHPSVQAVDGSVIFRQVRLGHVVVAGYPRGASDAVANRAPVDPRRTLATMRHLLDAVPALAGAALLRVWSGIEGYLPDMLPVIGPSVTTPGLLHAFGFCGHGFQLGPGVGAVLADLIVDGASATPIDAFAVARFADGSASEAEHLRREFDAALLARTIGATDTRMTGAAR